MSGAAPLRSAPLTPQPLSPALHPPGRGERANSRSDWPCPSEPPARTLTPGPSPVAARPPSQGEGNLRPLRCASAGFSPSSPGEGGREGTGQGGRGDEGQRQSQERVYESQPRRSHQARNLRCSDRGLSLPDLGRDIRRAVRGSPIAVGVFATAVRIVRTQVQVIPTGVGVVPISIAVPGPRSGRLAPWFGWRRPWPGSVLIRPEGGGARGGRADRERRDPGRRAAPPSVGVRRASRRWPTALLVCQLSKSLPGSFDDGPDGISPPGPCQYFMRT